MCLLEYCPNAFFVIETIRETLFLLSHRSLFTMRPKTTVGLVKDCGLFKINNYRPSVVTVTIKMQMFQP